MIKSKSCPMSDGHNKEDSGPVEGLYLQESLRRGQDTQEGINMIAAVQETLDDSTMPGGTTEKAKVRRSAKHALTRKKKQLEQDINGAVSEIEVKAAKDEFLVAFNKLEEAHDKFVSAKESDTDDPEDLAYMDKPIAVKITVLAQYKTWDDGRKEAEKIAREEASTFRKEEARKEEAERLAKAKAENLVRLRALLEVEVGALGDPERDFQETVNVGISVERMATKARKLEVQLEKLEEMRRELMAEEGEDAAK